jgi:hypothetical protein
MRNFLGALGGVESRAVGSHAASRFRHTIVGGFCEARLLNAFLILSSTSYYDKSLFPLGSRLPFPTKSQNSPEPIGDAYC